MAAIDLLVLFITDLIPWIAAYLIIALSLNLEYGYLGIPNFGKLLAVSGGGFVAGFLPGLIIYYLYNLSSIGYYYGNQHALIILNINEIIGSSPLLSIGLLLLTIIVAILFGAFLSFVSSYPALRLKEDYLAMTLLALGDMLVVIGYNLDFPVGGSLGVFVPSLFGFFTNSFHISVIYVNYIRIAFFLVLAILVYYFVRKLVNSPLGRVLRAIRDNETLAQTLGKDIVLYRRNVMMVAGALAALGGLILALNSQAVIAIKYNRVDDTFYPWTMVVVGGAANNFGVAIGVIMFVTLLRIIDIYKYLFQPYIPFDAVWLNPILFSIALALALFYRPGGIIKEKPTKTLSEMEIIQIINNLKNNKSKLYAYGIDIRFLKNNLIGKICILKNKLKI